MNDSVITFVVCTFLLLLSGCETIADKDKSASKLYFEALELLDDGYTDQSIATFNTLQTNHPSGQFTENAWLQKSYAHLQNESPIQAQIEIQEFIRNYPNHPNLDYALFMLAFNENAKVKNGLNLYINGYAKTDIQPLRTAKKLYQNFIVRFPDSQYAPYANKFVDEINLQLSDFELNQAKFYAQSELWVAAALRSQALILEFPNSPYQIEAWQILEQSFRELKLANIADELKSHYSLIRNP